MNSNQYNLTDFQNATAERIFQLFRDENQRRVLLADEVGLGKTLVARAVINKVKQWHINELNDNLFKVVYICSNEIIAHQNEYKLGIPRDSQISISESRLSMQHLFIALHDAECNKEKRRSQLLPMTPSTSLDMKQGCGTVLERALMFCILRGMDYFQSDPRKIVKLERLLNLTDVSNWESAKNYYQGLIDYIHSIHKDKYPQNLYPKLQKLLQKASFYPEWEEYFQPYAQVSNYLYSRVVPELRRIFATISINKLQPDLVIMDEFQRFNSLITSTEETDLGMLCHHFFVNSNPLKTKILLMSATPYKPYSTLTEAVEYNTNEHFEDFKSVFRFLYSDPESVKNFGHFESIWSDYSSSLQELRQNDWSVLIARKNDAQSELRSVLARTERRNDCIIKTPSLEANENSLTIKEGDVLSYVNICKFTQLAGLPPIPIEYAKSSPYLLSFMRDQYKIHQTLHDDLASRRNQDIVPKDKTSFLNEKKVKVYKEIPPNNARLQLLYDEILPSDKKTELLLWVPPSRPYYTAADANNPIGKVFDANKGFSKILIFSAWEMVPRMTAAMTSYEAERRIYSRLNKLGKKKYTYFNQESSQLLTKNPEALLTYPSAFLADLYSPSAFEGSSLSEILKALQKEIHSKIEKLKKQYQIVNVNKTSAEQVLTVLRALEDTSDSKRTDRLVVPAHTEEILSYMAVASPAVCALRTLRRFDSNSFSESVDSVASSIAVGITTLFNRPNAQAIVNLAFHKSKKPYYFNVLRYCAEGNFQAMLDEYAFVCINAEQFVQNMTPQKDEKNEEDNEREVPYLCTSRTDVDTRESFLHRGKARKDAQMSMRTNFAMGYYNSKQTDKTVLRFDAVRTAFNMPFRPFVLSTTSIGQEGLDFHAYCRKIMHWNLPNNPIDLEQREGRINRYMSLAIRQSLANSPYAQGVSIQNYWEDLINNVSVQAPKNNGMVPYWILPQDMDCKFPIERIVPMYPFSKDQEKYDWIIKVLSLYRLTLGQPNQDELIKSLDAANVPKEKLEELFFNLSPWSYARQSNSVPSGEPGSTPGN
ncbi:MAG: DEAD/DEAH box helicase family protein [Thermoguttaceae bacterium]|nr:DEAD/DEAH box helicase family protein [Thermoguttaceae bacterium]